MFLEAKERATLTCTFTMKSHFGRKSINQSSASFDISSLLDQPAIKPFLKWLQHDLFIRGKEKFFGLNHNKMSNAHIYASVSKVFPYLYNTNWTRVTFNTQTGFPLKFHLLNRNDENIFDLTICYQLSAVLCLLFGIEKQQAGPWHSLPDRDLIFFLFAVASNLCLLQNLRNGSCQRHKSLNYSLQRS